MERIYLHGAEAVESAGCKIQSAANDMLRAANIMEDCTRRLELLFGQGYGSNIDRLIEALENKTTP